MPGGMFLVKGSSSSIRPMFLEMGCIIHECKIYRNICMDFCERWFWLQPKTVFQAPNVREAEIGLPNIKI
jgi:hypothetical protein